MYRRTVKSGRRQHRFILFLIYSTFRLMRFCLLIRTGSGSNSALLWTYVIDVNMASVPNKRLYRAPAKVESAKNAAFNLLPPLKLIVNGVKAI